MPGINDVVAAVKSATSDTFGQMFYVFVLTLLHVGFFILSYYVYKLISYGITKLTNKKTKYIE